jgi:hypothetical protein
MNNKGESSVNVSLGLGNVIAAIVSWSVNHSILWALVHGLFGWFYLIYYVLGGGHR